MLHGRAAELADIHGLLADARGGRSVLLVVQGEAGSGKTALLEHAAADAKDFRVLRCTGVESEAELPFAALHLLLLDCLDHRRGRTGLRNPAPAATTYRRAEHVSTWGTRLGRVPPQERARVLERDGHTCQLQFAGCTIVDHVVPLAQGSADPENLAGVCAHCRVRDVLAKCLSWRSAQAYICCTSDVSQLWGG